MNFGKPIYAEIWGTKNADVFRELMRDLGVKFTEFKGAGVTCPESFYIFECYMNKTQMHLANVRTSALIYQ